MEITRNTLGKKPSISRIKLNKCDIKLPEFDIMNSSEVENQCTTTAHSLMEWMQRSRMLTALADKF